MWRYLTGVFTRRLSYNFWGLFLGVPDFRKPPCVSCPYTHWYRTLTRVHVRRPFLAPQPNARVTRRLSLPKYSGRGYVDGLRIPQRSTRPRVFVGLNPFSPLKPDMRVSVQAHTRPDARERRQCCDWAPHWGRRASKFRFSVPAA